MKQITIGIGIGLIIAGLISWYIVGVNNRLTVLENFATQVSNLIAQSQKQVAATK